MWQGDQPEGDQRTRPGSESRKDTPSEDEEDVESDEDEVQDGAAPGVSIPGITALQVRIDKRTATGTLSFVADLETPKLLLLEMAERTCVTTMIRHTPGMFLLCLTAPRCHCCQVGK
jgi:hypothetical protein